MTLGEKRQPYIMRKLLFRYPNVSYRQSEGEYRMVESIKNQIQKLFLSALIFHRERPVIHIAGWAGDPSGHLSI
jgi:hypothetical protein